jgi:hypothetical protein
MHFIDLIQIFCLTLLLSLNISIGILIYILLKVNHLFDSFDND